jgi:hypothetical protein
MSPASSDSRDDTEWLFAACMLVLSVLILLAILRRE